MDLDEIKSIIEVDGGKFIIVENNKPSLVVISFEDYKKYLGMEVGQNQSLFETAKQDVGKDKVEEKDKEDKEKSNDELTIDDLPL